MFNQTSKLKDLRVLYVEDEDMIRDNVQTCLDFIFKDTIVARDGEEGLQKFLNEKVDLIITDLNMPIKNGISMIRDIKKIAPMLPIIITTACTKEITDEARDLGVKNFISKPFDIKELIEDIYTLTA